MVIVITLQSFTTFRLTLYFPITFNYIIIIMIIIITKDLYCAAKLRSKLSILRHVAEAFLPARQGTILNSHRVIGIATNTSMVLNSALVTYIMMTAEADIPSTPTLPPLLSTQHIYFLGFLFR